MLTQAGRLLIKGRLSYQSSLFFLVFSGFSGPGAPDSMCHPQPATIASILGPISALIRNFNKIIAGLFAVCTCGGSWGTLATVAGANFMGEPNSEWFESFDSFYCCKVRRRL